MSRRVYLDVGTGWQDVSHLVLYSSLSYTKRAASDNYHRAQNIANFSIKYDYDLFTSIYAATSDILCYIMEWGDDYLGAIDCGLYDSVVAAEETIDCGDYSGIDPEELLDMGISHFEYLFTGRKAPTASRKYNGILSNQVLALEFIDSSDLLSKEVGDVVFYDCAIMSSLDTEHSLVHLLAALANFHIDKIDASVSIPATYTIFAPNNPTDSVLDVLDVLLFENGYVLNFDEKDRISPVPWIVDPDTLVLYEFNENNMLKEISVDEQDADWDKVELSYFNLLSKDNVRIYTENLPYASDGSFAGYSVPAGYYWPIEANATDRITLMNTIIYQEYDDAGIKFVTNEAIVKKLDYNYKAFPSDFSGIVATSNHVLSVSVQALSLELAEFGNKRARILYKNNQATAQDIFFLHIDGTVFYKSMERLLQASAGPLSQKIHKYQSYFVYTEAVADALAKNLVQMATAGSVFYTFESLASVREGSLVRLVTDDATDQICFLVEKTYSEENGTYRYKARGYEYNVGTLRAETNIQKADIGSTNTAEIITDLDNTITDLASTTTKADNSLTYLSDMSSDSLITPQEKVMVRLRWADIDGYVGLPGSYLQTRASAIEAGVTPLSLDYAYGRLYDQLFDSPGVLRADFATNNIPISSSFYAAWSVYYQYESQTLATISRWSSLESIVRYDCGVYDETMQADYNPELDNGEFNKYQHDDADTYDYGEYSSVDAPVITTDCGDYSSTVSYVEIIDMEVFDPMAATLYNPPDVILDCGIFTAFA